jgi:putative membrane protein
MLDLALAAAHHILAFGLVAVLFDELTSVRKGMDEAAVARLARMDMVYGALAGALILIGIARVAFAAKGWLYYVHNLFFWGKMGAFVLVGLMSIPPTLAFRRWMKAGGAPAPEAVAKVRRWLIAQAHLIVVIVACAAAMARGFGAF